MATEGGGGACLARRLEAGALEVTFAAGKGRHRVWGAALLTRRSVCVNLHGGESPHIGAVGIGLPRPSLRRQDMRSATTSVVTVPGHKEDELVQPLASELARRLRRTSVVVAGMHLRNARARDIAALSRNTARAVELFLKALPAAFHEHGGSQAKRRGR